MKYGTITAPCPYSEAEGGFIVYEYVFLDVKRNFFVAKTRVICYNANNRKRILSIGAKNDYR